jgi:hypothetical protein
MMIVGLVRNRCVLEEYKAKDPSGVIGTGSLFSLFSPTGSSAGLFCRCMRIFDTSCYVTRHLRIVLGGPLGHLSALVYGSVSHCPDYEGLSHQR